MDMKQLREKLNLRTVDVASRLNIGESTIRSWEKGRAVPRYEQIRPLMNLYEISFEQLEEAINEARRKNVDAQSL
jgi:DNA-binding transcriptional regulator YiaG